MWHEMATHGISPRMIESLHAAPALSIFCVPCKCISPCPCSDRRPGVCELQQQFRVAHAVCPNHDGLGAIGEHEQPATEIPATTKKMVRSNWLNLNGIWEFQAGATNQPVPTNQTLSQDILVPFPMESALSGHMQHHDFL